MKKHDDDEIAEEELALRLRSRPVATLNLRIPEEVLASLGKIAASRDMTVEALVKLYVGHGLRQDLAKTFADRVMEKTATVLTRHLESGEVSSILQEIRQEADEALDQG